MSMNTNPPLPYSWVQQVDPTSGHVFYVDTKANPPRSIWTHPYEDEIYLKEHPDVRNKVHGANSFGSDALLPLPPREAPRRHSFNGREATPMGVPPPKHKEGFFEKLKTKAIESMEKHNERRRQRLLTQQRMFGQSTFGPNQYTAPQYAMPQTGYSRLGSGMGRRRGGMGGIALPLMGGMAGGLLLGDILGNDNGGGWGGGGEGGDWGGGGSDFGGGGSDFGGGGGDFGGGGGDFGF